MKLDRDVAIKVLPDDLAADPDRLARFEREAKLLAALNHSNIGSIYGLEETDSVHFLVLELIEGESLEQRLRKGAIPVPEALHIALQIAEALEAAHDTGIIHRDVKPANVLVTPDGRAKVLDFGIAKSMQVDAEVAATALATNLTVAGTLVGTPSYMSPEQVRGEAIDKRADIWAFGCLLFETLTGRSAFGRETLADTLSAIVEHDPDWEALPELAPAGIRILLRRCLRKDPGSRLHDVADARIELEDAAIGPFAAASTTRHTGSRKTLLPWGAAGLMAILAVSAMWAAWQSAPAGMQVVRSSLNLPPEHAQPMRRQSLALSPDGTWLAYAVDAEAAAPRQLYLRDMSTGESMSIPGTEGAEMPFWSPDGRWVGFLAADKLKKVQLDGMVVLSICECPGVRGASWGLDDTIVIGGTLEGLRMVSASGGIPAPITTVDREKGERTHRWPQVLPDGTHALVSIVISANYDDSRIAVVNLETDEIRELGVTAAYARYVPTGHLIYAREDTLYAVLFDPDTLEVTGSGYPVQPGVNVASAGPGSANFTFSASGTLVYFPRAPSDRHLVLVDLQGNLEPLGAAPMSYQVARFAPDGDLVVVVGGDYAARYEVYTYEREAGRLTLFPLMFDDPAATFLGGIALSPDGLTLAINGTAPGENRNLYSVRLDGSEKAERLDEAVENPNNDLSSKYPEVWAGSGHLLYQEQAVEGAEGTGIFDLSLETGFSRVAVDARGAQREAAVSAGGLWTAYSSNESGPVEVYVMANTPPYRRRQVSTEGGSAPLWAPDGRTLYFMDGNRMMAAEITTTPALVAGRPRPLFEVLHYSEGGGLSRGHDLSPDGERFVMIQDVSAPRLHELRMVINWFEELKQLVPTGR